MAEFLPVLIVGAIIGAFAIAFVLAYIAIIKEKEQLDDDRQMSDKELIMRLLAYAKPHWKSFVLVLFIMAFSIVYDILSPLIIGDIQNLVKDDFQLKDLYIRVAVYAGILIVSMVCTYMQAMILQKIGQKILSDLRMDIFTHIEKLSHKQLNKIPVGKLVTRVTNDTNSISMMFTNVLVTMIKNAMLIVGVLGAMLMLNYALTLMVLMFVPFVVLFTVIFRKFSRRAHRKVNDTRTDINTYLSENLSGIKITQIFNREEQKMQDFLERSDRLKKARFHQMFVFGIFRPMVYMLNISTIMCLMYFGAKGQIHETVLFGQTINSAIVVSFYMYISKFYGPIQNLAEQFDVLQRSFAAAEKIFTIMDMVPEIVDEPDAIELEEIRGEIEFKDVWFAYKPGEWVLKGVSFHVEPKQTVAFVGSTGSGKTTILSLMVRNYDIQKGQILIDGIDIKDLTEESLRKNISIIRQTPFLFNLSIMDNFRYVKEDIKLEEVREVCKRAYIDDYIMSLPNGYDTIIGEGGVNLSGGQKQRIAIARTLLKNSPIILFDEATSALDNESQDYIKKTIDDLVKDHTIVIVAHRLSTIVDADVINIIDKGKLVDSGKHKELLEKSNVYQNLYKSES
jgi:ATP-binding cassette subfamily B protein